jgi:serine/threonine-protein kinase
VVAGLAGAGALAAGVLVYAGLNPARESASTAAPATAGLPEIRSPEKFVSSRERELVALLDRRDTPPRSVIEHSVELGLLYVREGRLDEADARFARLEKEQLGPVKDYLTRRAGYIGRLGHAVATAYRDGPNAAQQSNEMFVRVILDLAAKGSAKADRYERGYRAVAAILIQHLDLAQAVSEALNRNANALGKPRLEPNALELLRSPPKSERKD